MPKFAVILAAAGQSSRFGDARRKKPFIDLKGRPVWVRAIEPLVNHPDVVQSLIVVAADDVEWFTEKFRPNLAFMNVDVIAGGKERADSVQNALAHVKSNVDYVAVHDAARPLLVKKWVDEVFAAAIKSGAAIPASPIASTIKRVAQGKITETVPREHLWGAQTPQVFERKLLLEAFAKRDKFVATDEAQLVERIGHAVSIVDCSPLNIKITTQEDFRMAEALLEVLPKEKSLANMHPFAADNPHLFKDL
ncbi:2-C-methyl-D-erythritol 4-phosphate cytidylyltransferase [Planctomicrobium piriforme]|uniref:2-C-methyl-D-erythritol 4-phosphate cytidylyltransferase n=1 Tax=Planctomicrobium piriforme TaxID=1576369 RepID=A0A1I3QTW4_9PLAN|nr:2-C-methyl-D-erythritol 4-phosphate cytidylyltransferase [Planctomicrobium piriforme]SFJ37538.1 2-C-methyl-D-erythritol 4-phosphate cytidylyltransferase [Planctomicrobium piriforme]